MSDDTSQRGEPPSGGRVLAGFLLLLFGLCLLLVGGGCTAMWLFVMFSGSSWGGSDGAGLFIVSLVVAVAGIFAIVQGVKMLRWRKPSGGGEATGAGPDGSPKP